MKFPLFFAALIATSPSAADAPNIDPAKPATVTLSVQDWQSVLMSVGDSERVSAREASRIDQTIVNQIQQQIEPQNAKPKN